MLKGEALEKSIDSMIDELFEGAEALEKAVPEKIAVAEKKPSNGKAIGDSQKPNLAADENGAEKQGEEDEEAGKKRGRPDDLSQMSKRNMATGASSGKYDDSITSSSGNKDGGASSKGDAIGESQKSSAKANGAMKKSVEISEEDFEILQKAKIEQAEKAQAESLKKAREEQSTLIKSAVAEATADIRKENEVLRKSLEETSALLKSLAKKPQPRKAISSAQVLEKSFGGQDDSAPREESFSKSEMLDCAEALVKARKLTVEEVIELEDTGYIYNPNSRKLLEAELQKRK